MKKIWKVFWIPVFLLLVMTIAPSSRAQSSSQDPMEDEQSVLVGRISHVEGQLLRYVEEEDDWVATVQDAPFGIDDALSSNERGRAEFMMPNNTRARIDGDTRIQLVALEEDLTQIDVASGKARFYNKDSETVIKATTPYGHVIAPPGTAFDLSVDKDAIEVISLKGTVDFVHHAGETRFNVNEGSSSIVAGSREVATGKGRVDPVWDMWNQDRDGLWAKRAQVRGESARYLPPRLHDDAYVLEENGRWEPVYYEGDFRYFWRPVRVGPGWEPFTAGRWSVWYDDNTWIPDEPFGYVTHHYGNWVYVHGFWYWAPPVVHATARLPLLHIGFGWYPGRVAWVHSDVHVGWVPLAPFEPYYCHRYWGRRSIVYGRAPNIHIHIDRYRYAHRAVIVHQSNFYHVRNYRSVRINDIASPAIVRSYRGAQVIDRKVIGNYHTDKKRYHFSDVEVTRKPNVTAVERIRENREITRNNPRYQGKQVLRDADRVEHGKPVRETVPDRVTTKNKPGFGVLRRPSASEPKSGERQIQESSDLRPREKDVSAPEVRSEGWKQHRPPATPAETQPGNQGQHKSRFLEQNPGVLRKPDRPEEIKSREPIQRGAAVRDPIINRPRPTGRTEEVKPAGPGPAQVGGAVRENEKSGRWQQRAKPEAVLPASRPQPDAAVSPPKESDNRKSSGSGPQVRTVPFKSQPSGGQPQKTKPSDESQREKEKE